MPTKIKAHNSFVGNAFLVIVMLELFLMGSGRFLTVGPVTVRMILFSLAIACSLVLLIQKKGMSVEATLLLSAFLAVHAVGFLMGTINNAEMRLMLIDIKPLLFFLMIIFFCTFIHDVKSVKLVIKTIKIAAILLAFSYLAFLLLYEFNIIHLSAETIYKIEAHRGKDVRFQQVMGVFYNGFLYLSIGCLFYFFEDKKFSKLIAALMFAAVVLTFSRGFLLAIVLVFVVYLSGRMLKSRRAVVYAFCLALTFAAAIAFVSTYLSMLGNKAPSDVTRIVLFRQVMGALTPLSLFVGHGLGIGTAERPIHMEVTYLEVLHKQGLLGLLFWFVLFAIIVQMYDRACKNGYRNIALPFLLSVLFIFIVTTTNPYLNNPLGMSMVLISIAVLNVLAKENTRVAIKENSVNGSMSYMQK